MLFLNSLNSVTGNIFQYTKWFKPTTYCIRDQDTTKHHQDARERQELSIDRQFML